MTKRPDASQHNGDPEYLRSLIEQSGLSIRQTADQIGIRRTELQAYLYDEADERHRTVTYPVQFALECLAIPEKAND
jgi:transcriptional regulator with XRE-family HTH domain